MDTYDKTGRGRGWTPPTVPVPPLDNNEPNSEYWSQRAKAEAETVTWTLDLEDAEALWEYLHHNRPGGYQHVHDGLREAITRTKERKALL